MNAAHGRKKVKALEVDESDVMRCDLANLNRLFDQLEKSGQAVRLRGTIELTFPCFDADPRGNYLIPEIRAYISAVYAARPHFMYYTIHERAFGVVAMHLMAMMPLGNLAIHGNTAEPKLDEAAFARFAGPHVSSAFRFCRATGDDETELMRDISQNFPESVWTRIEKMCSEPSRKKWWQFWR